MPFEGQRTARLVCENNKIISKANGIYKIERESRIKSINWKYGVGIYMSILLCTLLYVGGTPQNFTKNFNQNTLKILNYINF